MAVVRAAQFMRGATVPSQQATRLVDPEMGHELDPAHLEAITALLDRHFAE